MIFIAEIALDSVLSFTSIPAIYRQLKIFWTGQGTTAGAKSVQLTFNSDGTTNYDYNFVANAGGADSAGNSGTGAAFIRIGRMPGSDGTGKASGSFDIPYYATTTQRKAALGKTQSPEANSSGGNFTETDSGSWRTTNAAISSMTFAASAGAFAANSKAALYGIL